METINHIAPTRLSNVVWCGDIETTPHHTDIMSPHHTTLDIFLILAKNDDFL